MSIVSKKIVKRIMSVGKEIIQIIWHNLGFLAKIYSK